MKAILHDDQIVRLSVRGPGTEIGEIPAGIGLDRLRWNGSQLVDLNDLTTMHVRCVNGVFTLHCVPVPGSQAVPVTWPERKRLVADAGSYRALTPAEWAARLSDEAADHADNQVLHQELRQLVADLTFAAVDAHVETVFNNLNVAQKTSLKRLYKVVLFLAKKQG